MRIHTPAFLVSLRFHQIITLLLVGVWLFNGAMNEGRKANMARQDMLINQLLSYDLSYLTKVRVSA